MDKNIQAGILVNHEAKLKGGCEGEWLHPKARPSEYIYRYSTNLSGNELKFRIINLTSSIISCVITM